MIYACDNCHFIFRRFSQTDQCPDCGKYDVRPATSLEQEEFEKQLKAQAGSPLTDYLTGIVTGNYDLRAAREERMSKKWIEHCFERKIR